MINPVDDFIGNKARPEANFAAPKTLRGKPKTSLAHKIHGSLQIVRVCSDWPKWFHEHFKGINDGSACCYRMRCGTRLHTHRNDGLKIDCEGAEYDILSASAAPLLKRVRRISMEYHKHPSHGPSDLETLLRENCFEVRRFGGDRMYARRLQ